MKLNKIKTLRFSEKEVNYMALLEELNISPAKFIRKAFKEKLKKELPHIYKSKIEEETKPPF